MLNKTLQQMKEFETIYNNATETYKRSRKEINENYKGKMASSKLSEAKNIYELTLQDARKKGYQLAENEFENAKKEVLNIITKEVPSDFSATILALQSGGFNVSEIEAKAYINKYIDNYTALKNLLLVLHKNNIAKNYKFISAESIISTLDKVLQDIQEYYYGYIPQTYVTAIMIHEKGLVQQLINTLELFLKGNFIR
ncbi:hypothetical protein [Thomasclavelia spiroformis]|uniref:hypothetical protein n=1 Tax=Thomasclavelia spiroformis TaxID=29348 RepID=UPI0039945B95